MIAFNTNSLIACTAGIVVLWSQCLLAEDDATKVYRETIQPILASHCFDCHADGSSEGDLSFDSANSDKELISNRQMWWTVLKNVRADIMPPSDAEPLSSAQKRQLTDWIKTSVFGIDPTNVDPGRVTVRRLNRAEYRNTIRDLMGIDFNAEVVFPPDDTGFGFDNVGDALSLSPLLLEKYLQAATTIVKEAVPTVCKVMPVQQFTGKDFKSVAEGDDSDGARMSCKEQRTVANVVQIKDAGAYRLQVQVMLHGSFDFDPSQCRVTCFLDEEALYSAQHAWDERKKIDYEFERELAAGEHKLSFRLEPLDLPDEDEKEESNFRGDPTFNHFHVQHVDIEGPLDTDQRVHPANYERFFPRDEPPADAAARREYAREVLSSFTKRAYRRPADDATLDKLVLLAEFTYEQPDKTFEAGIAQAITAILASPRFLFRLEAPIEGEHETFPLVDEYSLASRLSYFLWTTMPDAELTELADKGALRENLDSQIERMLKDERSDSFVRNFVGQWLRARDVEHVSLDPIVALGYGEEYEQLISVFRRRFRRSSDGQSNDDLVSDGEWEKTRQRFRELREIRDKFDGDARRAMRQETEMLFEHIVREDRSVLELLDANYTFLNEKLANLYDIPNVEGREMRKVSLPEDSPRGGVLTQATMLTATSNPTRTSPVKRGLYILENILGTPSPPAPPNVPALEATAGKFGDREPPLRELLALHRESELCASCHNRMDPLGIALENFNALGMWRETESDQPIDASGTLATGESFRDVRDLKKILVTARRADFYRCMTQKLMTYALGRGLEDIDEYTVDQIADELEKGDGRFSVLLKEVIKSAPFQRQRSVNE
ncbi:MAG: DUF1592 domain-containing protein [Planctomycetales bacterium]|nr:DUF1592 domain-containing protein [Planctomycetales bacterium]